MSDVDSTSQNCLIDHPMHARNDLPHTMVTMNEDDEKQDLRGVQLRYLDSNDVSEVKQLCSQIFPVNYPDYWYEDITSNPNLWSMAATYEQHIIGLLVAQVKWLNQCDPDDRNILAKSFPANTPVCYLLSLGVHKVWRRHGVASYLLDHLLAYLQSGMGNAASQVRCLYLHVLVSNVAAIGFYERKHFQRHTRLRYYYYIDGVSYDGYTYVLYLNGGRPSCSLTSAAIFCSALVLRPWLLLWHVTRSILYRAVVRR